MTDAWSLAFEKVIGDGPWAAFSVLLLLFCLYLVRCLITHGKYSSDALVANAEALTALRTHIEIALKIPAARK